MTGVKTASVVVGKAGFVGIFGEGETGVLFHAGSKIVGIAGPVFDCFDRATRTVKAGIVFAADIITTAAVIAVCSEVNITFSRVVVASGLAVGTEAYGGCTGGIAV
ncbi:MAG: hypothetical protein CSA19_00630 [Deltaproteobacteria bacterium]|nr:MAG: hypothetical protein CSA19_00630 [Deltaproteobacteria bacterium]